VTIGQTISLVDIDAGWLQFTPDLNANGASYASFTFQVQDNGGTADGGMDLDASPKTITIDVTSVNDEPAGADMSVTMLENSVYTFTVADFAFDDPSDSPADSLIAVKISTLPTLGALTNNGVAVTGGQHVSLADIASGLLKFTPAAMGYGAGYASFTFQVQDNGGTADSGVDLDASPKTCTIDVTEVLAAEIDVRGGGVTIFDGDTTPSLADDTDFGSKDVLAGTVIHAFGIVNLGNIALNLTGAPLVQITGANASDFSVTYLPNSSIAVGSYTFFQITFDPTALGLRTATVTIANNDSDEALFRFDVQGTGIVGPPAAEIDVRGGGITIVDGDTTPSLADATDFGSKEVLAGTVIHAFGIVNLGNIALNLIGTPLVQITGASASDFSVTYLPNSSIAVGSYTFFQITFDPTALGLRTATVTIANTDSDESLFHFDIQGTGIVGPPAAEIDVRGGGFTIVDGDTTPSLADATDFGSKDVLVGTVIRAFGIVNLGNIALELTGTQLVQITGANASDFRVTYQPRASIAVGSFTFFQITFDPTAIGLRKATVTIANTDSDEGLFQFDIQGMGV